MKCPLVFSTNVTPYGDQRFVFADCIKTECAWWNDYFCRCSITVNAYLKEKASA